MKPKPLTFQVSANISWAGYKAFAQGLAARCEVKLQEYRIQPQAFLESLTITVLGNTEALQSYQRLFIQHFEPMSGI